MVRQAHHDGRYVNPELVEGPPHCATRIIVNYVTGLYLTSILSRQGRGRSEERLSRGREIR